MPCHILKISFNRVSMIVGHVSWVIWGAWINTVTDIGFAANIANRECKMLPTPS
jgi:hypothetical protein